MVPSWLSSTYETKGNCKLCKFTVAFSTDEEAAASKRMVIYAFSVQINLFTSFFLKQPLFPFMQQSIVYELFNVKDKAIHGDL